MTHQLLEAGLRNLAAWSLQVGVIALVAAALSRLVPIERPDARLAFGQALLALSLGLPLLQPWRATASEVGWSFTLAPLGPSASAGLGGALSSTLTPAWPAGVVALLLVGLSVQLARVGLGLVRIRWLLRRARPWDTPAWMLALRDELAPQARFLVSNETGTPATCGLRQPTILLPTAFESMDRERQRAIALHELVHARRGDWLPLILEELLKAVLFFHPAVHWLVERIRLAREQTVDAVVVGRLGAREVYLESLVEVARIGVRARAVPAALFLRESHLRERVNLLLKEVVMSRVRTQINVAVSAAAILLAVSWAVSAAPLQSTPSAATSHTIATARFTVIDGGVQVRRAGTLEWIPATPTIELRGNDLVRTGSGASAAIRFADGALINLRPDSLIRIEDTPDPVPVSIEAAASGPRLVRKVQPTYPPEAKADKAQGVFVIELLITRDGSVQDPQVVASAPNAARLQDLMAKKGMPEAIEGDPRLAAAALDAVRAWQYEPLLKDGQPVAAKATVTVNFKLLS